MIQYRFAIVGTGIVAEIHAKAIQAIEGSILTGVYNRDRERAKSFSEKYSCGVFDTLEELGESDKVDVVTICTPSGTHMDSALYLAAKGKHLIIEKPLEVTEDRCETIIAAAAAAGVRISTVFQTRFHSSFQRLKKAMIDGRFGTITLASAYVKWYREQRYYEGSTWRGTWELDGGGALMNQSIHAVDLLLWLMGPVSEVHAFGGILSHTGIEVEDTLVGLLRYSSGAMGTIEATTGSWPGSFKKIEICGNSGHAVVEEDKITVWEFRNSSDESMIEQSPSESGGVNDPTDIGYRAHQRQFEDFLYALETERTPSVTGEDGKNAVALVRRLYRGAGLID